MWSIVPTTLCALTLLAHVVTALRLGKPAPSTGLSSSSSQRFPEDIFAHPAFSVKFVNAVVSNATAERLLSARIAGGDLVGWSQPNGLDAELGEASSLQRHVLIKASSRQNHLCSLSLPPPSARTKPSDSSSLILTPENLLSERHRVIQAGLLHLAPLKGTCLYHTVEWFTYSLCFGEGVRQFKAIDTTIGPGRVPAQDPSKDAFVLGRWRNDLEMVGGKMWYHQKGREYADEAIERTRRLSSRLGISNDEITRSLSPTGASSSRVMELLDASDDENGTELMQVIRFASTGSEQRYLSQMWTDGTLCDINNEPRSVEVQYHCNPALGSSRIALIKETTTCSYVMVVETPLTCKEKELRAGRHVKKRSPSADGQWKCSRIVEEEPSAIEQDDAHSSGVTTDRSAGKGFAEVSGDASRVSSADGISSAAPASESPQDSNAYLHTTSSSPWLPTPDNPALSSNQYYALGFDEDGNVVVEEIESWASDLLYQQEQLSQSDRDLSSAASETAETLKQIIEQAKAKAQDQLEQGDVRKRDQASDGDALDELITELLLGEGQNRQGLDFRVHLVDGNHLPKVTPESNGKGQKDSDDDQTRQKGIPEDELRASLARAIESELSRLRERAEQRRETSQSQQRRDQQGSGSIEEVTQSLFDAMSSPPSDNPRLEDGQESDTTESQQEPRDATVKDIFAELNRDARQRAWKPRPVPKQPAAPEPQAAPASPQEPTQQEKDGEVKRQEEKPATLADRVEEFYRNQERRRQEAVAGGPPPQRLPARDEL